MDAYQLDQTLIIPPEVPFADLARAMTALGAERDTSVPAAVADAHAGDPKAAAWRWPGGKPFITYAFDPALALRVLDVAGAPPALRAAIVERVRVLSPEALVSLAAARDPRDRLRFVFAARETERLELLPVVEPLRQDPDPAVAEAAASVLTALQLLAAARVNVLATLRRLREAVAPLFPHLDDPLVVEDLRPRPGDVAKLFDDSIREQVAASVERLWSEVPLADGGSDYPSIEIVTAPAGFLRSPNELSHKFPRGYRDIAGWLLPSRIWATWAFMNDRGQSAARYDGLAWIEDHWVWIPKAHRLVAAAIAASARPASVTLH